MDDEALDVGDVGEQREYLQIIDESPRLFAAALDAEGKDRSSAVGEIFFVQGVIGMIGQRGMVDLLDQRMGAQVFHDLLCILGVAFEPQREGLDSLQQQERVERRDRSAGIAQEYGADVGDEGRRAYRVIERHAVIAGVGVGDVRIFSACFPIEPARFDDDTAEGRAVAADELGGRVDDDIRAVLDGSDQIRRAEGVVDDQRQAVTVGYLGDSVDIGYVGVGIAEGLEVDRAGVVADRALDLAEVVSVDKGSIYPVLGQGMRQQVVAAAVDGLLGYYMTAVRGQSLDGIGDGGGSRAQSERRCTAFEGGEALLQYVLG